MEAMVKLFACPPISLEFYVENKGWDILSLREELFLD